MRHSLNGLDPSTAGSAPQMVALLRELRAGSGLSIREVSRRARDRGDWLPTSTLAAVLNRDSLPRSEVVAALVRACGGDETAVDTWLAQCARIAAADVADTGQVPRQLPPAPHAFTGREQELRLIGEHTRDAAPRAVVVSGPAGMGKTALALHWAHRSLDDFPDGQLYVDLRGFSGTDPLSPAPVLQRFLTALGTDADEIPADADERAAMYRSLLSHRRVLVVLDNARSPEQLRDLLPGTGGSTALITARADLLGLTATHGVPHLRLAPLTREESMDLLGAMVGRGRVATDPEAARGLAAACGDLPLALRLAACQTLAHPEQPLADLRDRIASAPLAHLDLPGDEAAGLRSCLNLTRDRLDPAERKALNAIGLHPATEFEAAGIAAITGMSATEAAAALHGLAGVHLTAPTGDGRWGVHDLVRAYAREQAAEQPDRDEAQQRLYDWYLAAIAGTWQLLFGLEPEVVPDTAVPVPAFTRPDDAFQWLDTRHAALVETVHHAKTTGHPWHASRLATTLWRYQFVRGMRAESTPILRLALAADGEADDRAHQVIVMRLLGNTHKAIGQLDEAERHLTESRLLALELGDRAAAALASGSLAQCHIQQWRLDDARTAALAAAAGFRELGDADSEVNALDEVAHIDLLIGDHASAETGFDRSIKTFADRGWEQSLGSALAALARMRLREDEPAAAEALLQRTLDAYRHAGDPFGELFADSLLALAQARLGDTASATALAEATVNEALKTEIPELYLEVVNNAGFTFAAAGEPSRSEALHGEALELAESAGDRYEQARALNGLGDVHEARGDRDAALAHWRRSKALHDAIGTYERRRLAELIAD